MRVVLDANVLISGLLARKRPTTTLGCLISALEALKFRLVTSEVILAEVRRNAPRLLAPAGASESDLRDYLRYLVDTSEIVEVTDVVTGVASHREDDRILATAVLGEVEFLVTGDKQLLALNEYRGVRIITPREFVDRFLI